MLILHYFPEVGIKCKPSGGRRQGTVLCLGTRGRYSCPACLWGQGGNIMRKKCLVFLALLLVLLTGCNRNRVYPFAYSSDQISNIEIVNIPASSFMRGGDLQDITSVKTVFAEDWEALLSDFHEVRCYKYFNDPPTILEGLGIRITYTDGSYDIVGSHTGCYILGEDIKYRWYGFDQEAFLNFIEEYRY